MMPLLATLPEFAWVIGACVVVGLVALVGIGLVLRFARELKSNLAAEIGQQLAETVKPGRMDVQQPLIVKPHEPCASLAQHEELREQFGELLEQRRGDVHGLHTKIEQGLQKVRTDITGEFKEVRETQVKAREAIAAINEQNANQTRELLRIRDTVEDMPEKIANLLKK